MPIEALALEAKTDCESSAALQAAANYLADGKWRNAERACQEVLKQGNVADAAYLLGRVYLSSGQPKRALEWFQKTVQWNPENAPAHFACAEILQREDPTAAASSWIAGIQIDPAFFAAHIGLADALLDLNLHDAAMIAARQALLVDADRDEAYDRLALAAALASHGDEAISALQAALALKPNSPDYLSRLASQHLLAGNLVEGRKLLERTIELQPRNAGVRFEYAQVLAKAGDPEAALIQLREAVRLQPRFPEALSNMGMLLRAKLLFSEAEAAYKKACAQNPGFAAAWNNLGNLYLELARIEDAERCYSKAIAADSEYAEAHTSRAMLRLLKGRFDEGWQEYEWRWKRAGQRNMSFSQPQWKGEDLNNRAILLHAEQGAGDTIQFCRYANDLNGRGARVFIHCPASLSSLMSSMPKVDAVFSGRELPEQFDFHVPMMSLPGILHTRMDSIPGQTPYLRVPQGTPIPQSLRHADVLRVGLVWSGNPNHHNDRNRSLSPLLLKDLLAVEGAQFFSLQVGGQGFEQDADSAPLVDLAPFLTDYAVTAACLDSLDLLITVDTSVAHLAGALGRPVWMAIPVCNDWRWLLKRPDSPWYPTMRIFRQQNLGDWKPVIEEMKHEFVAWTTANKRSA